MGERKGQNKYYPPDFDPKKHGSLNGYHGTHALRERARKLHEGILIIRFEMPYNIWCDGCKNHIAMGVRYNAQKTKIGMYYSTPLYKFRMKCHLCDTHFEIKTDPQNKDYVILSGARRKEQRWSMAENEQIVTEEKSDIKRLNNDPMFKLEHERTDEMKAAKLMPTLNELEAMKSGWKDDFELNQIVRGKFRAEKKAINEEIAKNQEFLDKWNIDIDLVKEDEDDIKMASLYKFYSLEDGKDVATQAEKRKLIEEESIFGGKKKGDNVPKTTNLSSADFLKNKLTRSIQEKKINGITSSASKSFSFDIKNSNNNNNSSNKLSSMIRKINYSNDCNETVPTNGDNNRDNNKLCLVSYDDDDSNTS